MAKVNVDISPKLRRIIETEHSANITRFSGQPRDKALRRKIQPLVNNHARRYQRGIHEPPLNVLSI